MSNWIEIEREILLNLDTVKEITIIRDVLSTKIQYYIRFVTDRGNFNKKCNSELEAQMIYARIKNYLCNCKKLNDTMELFNNKGEYLK